MHHRNWLLFSIKSALPHPSTSVFRSFGPREDQLDSHWVWFDRQQGRPWCGASALAPIFTYIFTVIQVRSSGLRPTSTPDSGTHLFRAGGDRTLNVMHGGLRLLPPPPWLFSFVNAMGWRPDFHKMRFHLVVEIRLLFPYTNEFVDLKWIIILGHEVGIKTLLSIGWLNSFLFIVIGNTAA